MFLLDFSGWLTHNLIIHIQMLFYQVQILNEYSTQAAYLLLKYKCLEGLKMLWQPFACMSLSLSFLPCFFLSFFLSSFLYFFFLHTLIYLTPSFSLFSLTLFFLSLIFYTGVPFDKLWKFKKMILFLGFFSHKYNVDFEWNYYETKFIIIVQNICFEAIQNGSKWNRLC